MQVRLDGKVAVVTGATRGIGRAIAETFVAAGADVVLTARTRDDLVRAEEALAAAEPSGPWRAGRVAGHAGNVADPAVAEACIDEAVARFGGVDVLVNNAATNPYYGPLTGADLARFDKTVAVNLRAPLVWTQLAIERSMRARRGAAVLNIASVGGLRTRRGLGLYTMTKAGLIHLTRQLAAELTGIRVNAIAAGLVRTAFAQVLVDEHGERLARELPTGRLGEPQDIADLALFLVSDRAGWITGETVVIDGGASVAFPGGPGGPDGPG